MRKNAFGAALIAATLIFSLAPAAMADDVADLAARLSDATVSSADRVAAAFQLKALGDDAKPAVPQLIEAMGSQDPAIQRAAISALGNIKVDRETAIPQFAKVLSSAPPAVAFSAIDELADLGDEVVPFMAEALQDQKARYWATLVLAQVGEKARSAVPALIKATEDADDEPEFHREAVLALGEIGGEDAIPALVQALEDDDPAVVIAATFSLGKLGADAKSATSALTKGMHSEDSFQRVVSAWAVAAVNPDDTSIMKTVVPLLVQGMVNPQRGTRIASAQALADLQPDAEILLPEIDKIKETATPEMIEDASAAIVTVGAKIVPMLIKMLDQPERRVRTARLLGQIGPDAALALPKLSAVLAESQNDAQREVLMAIGRMGPAAKPYVAQIAKMLDDEDATVRLAAAYALGEMGPVAAEAAEQLREHIQSDDFYCVTCAWALARIAPEDPKTPEVSVPLLIKALESKESFVRVEAAEALGGLGANAKAATEALQAATKDSDQDVRQAAAAALEKING